jgi:hypothetical protein
VQAVDSQLGAGPHSPFGRLDDENDRSGQGGPVGCAPHWKEGRHRGVDHKKGAEVRQLARPAAAVIVAEPPDTVFTLTLAEVGVQADVRAKTDMEGAEEGAEKDMHDKAPVETKAIATLEGEGNTAKAEALRIEEKGMGGQDNAAEKSNSSAGAGDHDTVAEGRAVPPVVDPGPSTMSDLPPYVLIVGLGVCVVVLQVVLKRVRGGA